MGTMDSLQQGLRKWKPFYASDRAVPGTGQQKILFIVACLGGMLPICNLAMISSSYLVLSGDLNADFADLARLVLTNILIMSIVQPLVNYFHAWLGLRSALLLSHLCIIVGGIGASASTTLLSLSLGYALMGFGSGLFMSLSVRIIATMFPPQSRKICIAVWTFSIGFGSNASPALAGYLVEFLTWHSLFLMAPILVLPCVVAVLTLLPDHSLPPLPPLDLCSLLFWCIFTVATLLAVCYGQILEWNSNAMISILFVGASALLLCVVSSCSNAHPLLHFKALRYQGVALALIAAIFAIVVHVGIRVEMILFMRNVMNYPPSQIGMMYILPLCIFMIVLVPVGITLTTHNSGKIFALIGFGFMFLAALLLSRLDSHPSWIQMSLPLGLSSIGFAMSSASMTSLLLRNVPPEVHPSLLVVINSLRFLGICVSVGILAPFSTQLNSWYLSRLASQATDASSAMTSAMAQWTDVFVSKGLVAATAHHNSLAMVTASLKKQASIFSYNHLFLYLALVACVGFCCLLLCRRQGAKPVYSSILRFCRIYYKRCKRVLLLPPSEPAWWGWKKSSRMGLLLLCLGLLPACSLGPDYQRPALDLPQNQHEDKADSPYLASAWWELFQDENLNVLEVEALRRNTSLALAMARVEESAARAGVSFADRLPSAGLSASTGQRQMTESEKKVHHYPQRVQDSYASSGFLRFELDLWGKYRRLDEAARAELLGTQAARDTVRLSLTAEVALGYVQVRTLQEQMRIAAAMLETYDKTCKIYETRYRLGQSPEASYRRFAAERSKTQTMLKNLEEKLSQCEGSLALLVGFSPAEMVERLPSAFREGKSLTQLKLPTPVPAAIPSSLLQRRPDVRSVEGQLMAANARIGAAKASFFPSLSLTADQGLASGNLEKFVTAPAQVWSVMGGITQPLFQGGRLRAQYRMSQAQYAMVLANYQASVQNAFRETRDALVSNALSREILRSSAEQVSELTRTNVLIEKQYTAGLASVMDVLDVRRQLLASQQELAEAQRRQLAGFVQVCRALGGGWTEKEREESAP